MILSLEHHQLSRHCWKRANLPHVQLQCEAMEVILEEADASGITKNYNTNGNDEAPLEEIEEAEAYKL
jgi:hypothetical protein